ncbi:MAG: hypothetical protein ACREID_10070 [Planctomycetota bacterium]
MKNLRTLGALLLAGSWGLAGPEQAGGGGDGPTYTLEEIARLIDAFHNSYNDKKQPEEDATSILQDLQNACKYIDSKGDQATKDELKLKKQVVAEVARGLKARNRPVVTGACAKALGLIGDKSTSRDLAGWLENVVLDAKNPHPQWLEWGFVSLALIGEEDANTLKLFISYAQGRHPDDSVPSIVITAIPQWRRLNPKNRKELFEKVYMYVSGLYGNSKKAGADGRAAKEQYDRVKDSGLATLSALAGVSSPFAEPEKVHEWWDENKKGRWEEYVGLQFREKKKEEPKKKEEGEKEGEDAGTGKEKESEGGTPSAEGGPQEG